MTMRLTELFGDLLEVPPVAERTIQSLSLDSRAIEEGGLFLACAGGARHGLTYIEHAIQRGAAAIAVELVAGMNEKTDFVRVHGKEVPLIPVPQLGERAGQIAARFYGFPSERLTVVGVTGTNGKTSVAHYVAQALSADRSVGVIGTLGAGLLGELQETGHTTPDPVTLQASLARLVQSGAKAVVMEVSSHGLHQGRVNGVAFDVAVFTNLSHEHLDYHPDFAAYAEAKRRLFDMPGLETAVLNSDDATGRLWLDSLKPGLRPVAYGLTDHPRRPTLWARSVTVDGDGLTLDIVVGEERLALRSSLLGRFNASNLLAALGALIGTGVGAGDAAQRLERVHAVPGRMERFGGGDRRPLVVVDYAHTPDALEQALTAIRDHTRGKLHCVFGCGGDRDRAKRPRMGKVARQLADIVVLTDDNPRTEDPGAIIGEILEGMGNHRENVIVERDRRAAMRRAIEQADPGDTVLIAGKGHETYQQIGDRRLSFSDRTAAAELLEEVAHG